jgi:uncharacterized protein YdaT
MSRNAQHVAPRGGKWIVRKRGAARATQSFDTQAQAIERATEIARKQQSEVYVHGRDGRIRERTSYGNDPFPPKG